MKAHAAFASSKAPYYELVVSLCIFNHSYWQLYPHDDMFCLALLCFRYIFPPKTYFECCCPPSHQWQASMDKKVIKTCLKWGVMAKQNVFIKSQHGKVGTTTNGQKITLKENSLFFHQFMHKDFSILMRGIGWLVLENERKIFSAK